MKGCRSQDGEEESQFSSSLTGDYLVGIILRLLSSREEGERVQPDWATV